MGELRVRKIQEFIKQEVSNILLFGGPPEASSRAINGGTGGSHGRGIVPIFREEGKHLVCRRFRRRG